MGATSPHGPGPAFPETSLLLGPSLPGGIDEAAFRAIVDAVPQMMWVNDPDGGVRFFNRFGTEYIGRPNEELAGRRWLACLHDDDREVIRAARTPAIEAGVGYTVEGRFRRHDGAYRWQRFEVQPVRVGDGPVVAWIGSARDIHDDRLRELERERLLAEIAAQRALFEAAYAQAPIGMTIADADGRMVQFNPEAERILGHPVVTTGHRRDYDRYHAEHADGRPYLAEEYATPRALEGAVVRQELMRYRRPDGTLRLLRVSGAPVRDASGRITHAVCTFVDVTEREAAERALAEREERLRAALDAARTGTFRWDIRTNALDWDENLDRLFGLEPGRTARSLDQFIGAVHPDDRERVVAACARCAADGADFDEEFRAVRPDGTIRWLHDKGRTYRDADGRPSWMTGACVDITESRRQRDELRALAETIPQLAWMADTFGTVDYVNARWEEYTGVPVGELVPDAWSNTVHPEHREAMRSRWFRAVQMGEPYEIVYPLRRADGAYRWFVGRAVPARDANGRVTRWFGSCTDIHDEVLVRERLQRLNAISEALADALDVEQVARIVVEQGIAAVGAVSGAVALLQPDAATLELIGAVRTPPALVDAWRHFPLDADVPMAAVARDGAARFYPSRLRLLAEHPALAAGIDAQTAESAAVLPLDWSGRRVGSIVFRFAAPRTFEPELRTFLEALARQCAQALERARLHALELTARREAEQARAEAQTANLAKGRFLAMMSHDLRTPINATLGYLELLSLGIRGPVTAEQARDIERMQQTQRVLLALVNEVLDYTRIDAGRDEYRRDRLPVRELLADVVPVIAPLAAAKGLSFEADAGADDALAAVGDQERVRRVLLNLLSNAVKFTASGAVRLTTTVDAATVRLAVADTGPGIPTDRLASIFQPFVQVDTTVRPRDGLGLGLAIARDLARAMDGDVTVESTVGKGSTFTVVLPRA